MAIPKFTYRKPPTPEGLRKIENDDMNWFDTEEWSNLNTGILEEYLDEKNRGPGFSRSRYRWKSLALGIGLGTIFAVITEYVGLKVGIAISGSWYVVYMIGLMAKWSPSELNIASGASTSTTYISTGFIFTFPAMYLLRYNSEYAIGMDENQEYIYLITEIPSITIPIVATIIAAFLGLLYFIIFRRVWLVEDPLPLPGIEAFLQLLDISNSLASGSTDKASKAIRYVTYSTVVTGLFTFLKDLPFKTGEHASNGDAIKEPVFDQMFGGSDMGEWYTESSIHLPFKHAKYTQLEFGLIPMEIGIGWFMRARTAILISLGTLVTWFIIIPMAVAINVPIHQPEGTFLIQSSFILDKYGFASAAAYMNVAKIVAIGTVLGGGVTALLKNAPVFKSATEDLFKAMKGEKTSEFIEGKGWYEWPMIHIPIMMVVVFIGISITFAFEYPLFQSMVFALVLVATTFFLGAIAVKVMGETGTEPVSGTSFIVLIALVILFKAMHTDNETIAIMSIIGTTVFGGAISMSGNIINDFKAGLYIGNRPYHIMKAEMTGIIPGAIVAVIGATVLSEGLARGDLTLPAPQAHAFAKVVQLLVGGESMGFVLQLLAVGILIGIFAEIAIGMGTAFGLGMYFPLFVTTPILAGGILRDLYEIKYLKPLAERKKWTEQETTLKRLESYMIATGLIVGEAVAGTAVAMYLVISS